MREALIGAYPWIKALHVIAVIAFMAGTMYLPRLFVYHHQAARGGEADRFFAAMERRLLKGIMNPSLVVVWALAALMIYANPSLLITPWFGAKLALVVAITGVHVFYVRAQRRFEAGDRPRSERFWRIINEAPFLLMVGVVFLAVVKPS